MLLSMMWSECMVYRRHNTFLGWRGSKSRPSAIKGTGWGKLFRPWSRRRFMTSIVVWLDAARAQHHNDTDRTKVRGILPATFTSVQLKGPLLRVRGLHFKKSGEAGTTRPSIQIPVFPYSECRVL
eukprot:scaffold29804_cov22-Cyclotella_meneghiniana.AAC.1